MKVAGVDGRQVADRNGQVARSTQAKIASQTAGFGFLGWRTLGRKCWSGRRNDGHKIVGWIPGLVSFFWRAPAMNHRAIFGCPGGTKRGAYVWGYFHQCCCDKGGEMNLTAKGRFARRGRNSFRVGLR